MAENMAHNITKQTWPSLFCAAWTSAITAVNMVSGFVATGIHPFNPEAIPEEAYLPGFEASEVFPYEIMKKHLPTAPCHSNSTRKCPCIDR